MDDNRLETIAARARAALGYERSILDEETDCWVKSPLDSTSDSWFECPLCEGEGELEGCRFDHKDLAGTVVAYGIGQGLGLAEDWVKFGPQDILDLVEEVRSLRSRLP